MPPLRLQFMPKFTATELPTDVPISPTQRLIAVRRYPLALDSQVAQAIEQLKAQVGAVRRHSHRRVRFLVHQLRLMRGRNRGS